MSWWDDWGPALPVEGGLTASGLIRGTRITTDAIGVGAEIVKRVLDRATDGLVSRGRAYARSGQTLSMTVEPGRVHALVQGSMPQPYSVSLAFDVPEDHRDRLIAAFDHALTDPSAGIPARGSGALREEIDECELLAGVPIRAKCTCPYGAVCKHCIAVAYIVADRLDSSPIAVATLFGVRDEHLGTGRAESTDTAEVAAPDRFPTATQRRLAKTLARIDATDAPTVTDVFDRAGRLLLPPAAVRTSLETDEEATGPE